MGVIDVRSSPGIRSYHTRKIFYSVGVVLIIVKNTVEVSMAIYGNSIEFQTRCDAVLQYVNKPNFCQVKYFFDHSRSGLTAAMSYIAGSSFIFTK